MQSIGGPQGVPPPVWGHAARPGLSLTPSHLPHPKVPADSTQHRTAPRGLPGLETLTRHHLLITFRQHGGRREPGRGERDMRGRRRAGGSLGTGCSGMVWDGLGCSGVVWDVLGSSGMPGDAPRWSGTRGDALRSSKVLWDAWGGCRMLGDAPGCSGTPGDAPGCFGVLRDHAAGVGTAQQLLGSPPSADGAVSSPGW